MDLFHGCQTVGDVKRRYRDYALLLHPDQGGVDWGFHELQSQYDKAKAILKALGQKQMIDAYNQAVEDRHRANSQNAERVIYITPEMKHALENMSLVERHFWRAINKGAYGHDRITAWDFVDWLNHARESVKARECAWARERDISRAAREDRENPHPTTLDQWIEQCGGLEKALAQLDDY